MLRLLTFFALAAPLLAADPTALFNGKDLSGWARIPRHENPSPGEKPGFEIRDGFLVSLPDAPEDDLWYTRQKIGNATLRVVYKISAENANSGIFIRIPIEPKSEDDAINKGIEVQIDNSADDYHCTGVLYSMTKAMARPYKPIGEWNTLEITLRGPRTIVKLNGVLVTDYDGVSPVPPKTGRYEPDRGPRPDSGYIAVQHHGGNATVTFKEITLIPEPAKSGALTDRAVRYFADLLKLDTTNPPGNESRVARYLKRVADENGIPAELLGSDPNRLNFVARLNGTGAAKPLLLMAHSDVVPADRSQWSVDPFAAVVKDGVMYARGAEDIKSLLAAELAVMVELKQSGAPLTRDIILVSESDEEAGSTGMQWLVANAWPKIDAEFGLNEFGWYEDQPTGERMYQIQTSEKVPTRIKLTARGVSGHGSLPRDDNPVAHLARAITRLVDAEQPVALNATTRAYFAEFAKLPNYAWLRPLLPQLESPAAAAEIRKHDRELDAMLHTTVSPTMLEAGVKINVIPNVAVAQLDIRRLPTETAEEVYARFKRIIDDPAVTIENAGGQQLPATEPSGLTTPLYLAMRKVFEAEHPQARTVPLLMRGATDGALLRAKGVAVYGVPLFAREGEPRWHGNDERIMLVNFRNGVEALRKIVLEVAH
ncbi:MAG TPA: M20/M25/M40 family metallo-hydrolase [Candidatus Solibacter sp.]|nr:M20/M25/M40 family metallo-hydrolase [Candidatus Solibacter sp.]